MSGRTRAWSTEERFWDQVDKTDECWLWTSKLYGGYGHFRKDGKIMYAHRASYEMFVGPIPADNDVHHNCEVRNCVRPDHLRAMPEWDHIAEENRKRYFKRHGRKKSYIRE